MHASDKKCDIKPVLDSRFSQGFDFAEIRSGSGHKKKALFLVHSGFLL
jgi:hypothetical protein